MSLRGKEAKDLSELRKLMEVQVKLSEEHIRISKLIELQLSTANRLKVLEMMPEMKNRLENYEVWMLDAWNQAWRK